MFILVSNYDLIHVRMRELGLRILYLFLQENEHECNAIFSKVKIFHILLN